MEKTLRDTVLKKTIEDLEISEDIVEKVVSWSYKNANEATKTNSEVEISGLGVFKVSPAKRRRRIITLERIVERITATLKEGRSRNPENDQVKIDSCKENIEYCNSKIKNENTAK